MILLQSVPENSKETIFLGRNVALKNLDSILPGNFEFFRIWRQFPGATRNGWKIQKART
jgi:hypothetical protein